MKNLKKVVYFLVKLVMHYFDFVTDILLVLEIKKRSENPNFSSETQFAYLQVMITLILGLLAERLLTYIFIIDFHTKQKRFSLQQQQQTNQQFSISIPQVSTSKYQNVSVSQNQFTVSQKQQQSQQVDFSLAQQREEQANISIWLKIKYFFIVITCSDYFFFLKYIKLFTTDAYLRDFRRHFLTECFIEAVRFSAIGISLILEDLYFTGRVTIIPVVSGLSSLANVIIGLRLFHIERERLKPTIKGKDEISFDQLSDESRLYILSIYQFQPLKENSNDFLLLKDLNIDPQSDKNIKHNSQVKNNKKEKKNKYWKYFMQVFLFIYLAIAYTSNMCFYLFSLSTIIHLKMWVSNYIAAVAAFPQFLLYMIEYFRQNKDSKARAKEVVKGILFYPIHLYFTFINFVSYIITENIPIFSSRKETWCCNLYPSLLKTGYKQMISTVIFFLMEQLMTKKNFAVIADSYQLPEDKENILNRITQDDSDYRKIYNFQRMGFYITTGFNCIFFLQWIYYSLYKKRPMKYVPIEHEDEEGQEQEKETQYENVKNIDNTQLQKKNIQCLDKVIQDLVIDSKEYLPTTQRGLITDANFEGESGINTLNINKNKSVSEEEIGSYPTLSLLPDLGEISPRYSVRQTQLQTSKIYRSQNANFSFSSQKNNNINNNNYGK